MNELLGKDSPYIQKITPAIQKSILIKENLFKKYIRSILSVFEMQVLKKSKQSYYKFFHSNRNVIKNI